MASFLAAESLADRRGVTFLLSLAELMVSERPDPAPEEDTSPQLPLHPRREWWSPWQLIR